MSEPAAFSSCGAEGKELLLSVSGLSISFLNGVEEAEVVRDVSFQLSFGQTLVLAGESGSGKTVTALSLCGLLPQKALIRSGSVLFRGSELVGLSNSRLREVRGSQIAYIFQEPVSFLNPVYTIGEQIAEVIRWHRRSGGQAAWKESLDLLAMSGIADPSRVAASYPHQLSGGMNQRALIAMALACHPKILVADEPTTSLDITTEAEIIRLLVRLKKELGFSLLFITHNFAIAQRIADRVAVMYQGRIVEQGTKQEVFTAPKHAHTRELLAAYAKVGRF